MFVYLSLILIAPLVYVIFRKKEYAERLALGVTCLVVFLLLALRSKDSGVDLVAYYDMYEVMKQYSFMEVLKDFKFLSKNTLLTVEWGYALFTWVFSKSGLPFQALLIVQSAFCVFSIYHFISKHSVKPSLGIVIIIGFGLVDYVYCIVRQAISVAILLFCADFAEKKQLPICVLLTFVATLFHESAIAFLVVIPLSLLPINWWTSLIFIGLSLLLIPGFNLLNEPVFAKVMEALSKGGYLSEGFEFGELIVVLLAIALFCTFFFAKKKEVSRANQLCFWAFMLTLPFQSLAMYMPIFGRLLTLTLMPFASVAITNCFLEKDKELSKVEIALEIAIFVAVVAYYGYCLYSDKRELCLVPYKLFFVVE